MWSRTTSFEQANHQQETWVYNDHGKQKIYKVDVTLGKPEDRLAIRLNDGGDFKSWVDEISRTRTGMFKGKLEKVVICPICNSLDMVNAFRVYGAQYVECNRCHHHFLNGRPSQKVLRDFYSNDESYQSMYTDERKTDIRLNQIAIPKANWLISQYQRLYGQKPCKIIDVGAGSGHFVKACRDLGIFTVGIEISATGRMFCKKVFDIDLIDCDFMEYRNDFKEYDIVTFWGVIEHVTNPNGMLSSACKVLSRRGLVVAETPRWDCLSTYVQKTFPNSIVRHLDPLGHVQLFTDSSLATAFNESGLDIVAAWYFGMDVYELVMQLSNLFKDSQVIHELGVYISGLQEILDLARLSDEMVFVGKSSNGVCI